MQPKYANIFPVFSYVEFVSEFMAIWGHFQPQHLHYTIVDAGKYDGFGKPVLDGYLAWDSSARYFIHQLQGEGSTSDLCTKI